jgi:elongation factor G
VLVGKPKVAYKETISGTAEARGKFVKQTGGRGQFGDCTVRVEPCTPEQAKAEELKFTDNFAFKNEVFGGAIPREYIPSVEYGARMAAKSGVLASYPLINVKMTLLDGSYHPVDSSQVAFEQAGSLGFREACQKASLTLLEPIMRVVITTPEDFVGSVTGDLSKRRGAIVNMEQRGNTRMVEAEVPLSEMFGYTTELRSMSQGRASSVMEPLKYAPVPAQVKNAILEEVG